ncbi:hypothetical protein JXM67_06470 [candidate division WOR-3 bacterium]|nr:hypothetical protein [candidate division WOR-3 bacterium]
MTGNGLFFINIPFFIGIVILNGSGFIETLALARRIGFASAFLIRSVIYVLWFIYFSESKRVASRYGLAQINDEKK